MNHKPTDRVESETVFASVLIAADPAVVWRFFDDGPRFAAWIGAFAGQTPLPGTRIEPRVGGQVRVCYPGSSAAAVGVITAMEPLRRIAFTWGYEDGLYDLPSGSTQIEIRLTPVAEGTLVELRHSGISNEEVRRNHLFGWKHYLSMLARQAADLRFAESLPQIVETFFRAWRETDAAARARLLEICCETEVRFRGHWACTDGLAELSDHIGNGQRHMPGMSLHAATSPQHVHGYARAAWAVRTADGKDVMSGVNTFTLAPSGKLATIVSFGDS